MLHYTQEKCDGDINYWLQISVQIFKGTVAYDKHQYSLDAIGRFKVAKFIDLNIGYYVMMFDEEIQKICTIVLNWVAYTYQGLPMGIFIAPDVLQEKMSNFFIDMVYACVYMDDLVIIIKDMQRNYIDILDGVLKWLKNQGCRPTQLNMSDPMIHLVV